MQRLIAWWLERKLQSTMFKSVNTKIAREAAAAKQPAAYEPRTFN